MPFLMYALMLIAVLSSVALGLDWVVTPPPQATTAQAARQTSIPMAETAPAVSVVKPTAKAVPATPNPDHAASANVSATPGEAKSAAGSRTASPSAAEQARAQATGATAAHCNVQACGAAYQSFRESDCTYQPYDGPRRLCTK
jgi:hypothetical protein